MKGISPAVGVNGNDGRIVKFKAGVTGQRLAETIGLGILASCYSFRRIRACGCTRKQNEVPEHGRN